MPRFFISRGVFLALALLTASGCHSGGTHGKISATTVFSPRRHAEEAAVRKTADAHAHYANAVIHEANEDVTGALAEYYLAALGDPENESLVLEVSKKFLQNKQPEKALQILTRAASVPSATGQIHARLGFVLSQQGKYDQAVQEERLAIRKSPESISGYQNLFLNYVHLNRYPDAMKALDEAAARTNTDADFLISLGELYVNLGLQVPSQKAAANMKARKVLARADKLTIATPIDRLKLADTFNQAGDTGKASSIYQELLKKYPNMPMLRERLRGKLSDIYLRGNDHAAAIEQLRGIIKDDPTNPQAYFYLGTIFYEDKNFLEAIDAFQKTILMNPDFEPTYYDLAGAQLASSKAGDALVTLGKARNKFPPNFGMEFLTGMAFNQQKAYTEAIQHYTAAEIIAQAGDAKKLNEFFYFQLGAASERKGDFPAAEKAFRKALELSPNSAESLNYLGYMWAERGTNLAEAKSMIEKALKLEPKNAAFLDSMGWTLYKLNQPTDALPFILRAAELEEQPDATLYDHLGDIYSALRETAKARDAWKKSLSLDSAEAVKRKLEKLDAK